MKVRQIFRASILNPASNTKSNLCYLMVNPERIDKPNYLTSNESLEKLITTAKAGNTFVDIQYPDHSGVFFDRPNKITYSYRPIDIDDINHIKIKLSRYIKP